MTGAEKDQRIEELEQQVAALRVELAERERITRAGVAMILSPLTESDPQ